MHFGASAQEVERGRERLAFEELLYVQLALLARRARERRRRAPRSRSTSRPSADRALARAAGCRSR